MNISEPGFADPVTDAQACFRRVLDAMARPGSIHRVQAPHPAPLHAATAAVLLTLLDNDTCVWLDDDASAARDWVAFHCGAPAASLPEAAFAVALTMPRLQDIPAGTDDAPEEGATLVLQVASLGVGTALRLSGPGLRVPVLLHVTGLPDDFVAQWRENHRRFPRGVDIVLCAGEQVAALPRSVAIEVA